jgi:dolichol-phosphate mannosyltransferase
VGVPTQEELVKAGKMPLSIILPTYNESQNIARMLDLIAETLSAETSLEIIVVDDNSPDRTADIAIDHSKNISNNKMRVKVIRRPDKQGLSSAILAGVRSSTGDVVVIMDGDFSHPPQTIPSMVQELKDSKYDIVIASRYIKGGAVIGWPFKRRLMSRSATKIAQLGLGIEVKDPMSGFFAFRRRIIEGLNFDAIGYKMLLEILVKTNGARVKELPYTFTNRVAGASKLDSSVAFDYFRAVWKLYRYGKSLREKERRTSVRFLSKAGRFYTIGAIGLLINYAVATLFGGLLPGVWYLYAALMGILFSITSNFFLNKLWTFEDRDFAWHKTLMQFGLFAGFSSPGAAIQLSMLYMLHGSQQVSYPIALILAVMVAAVGNFLLNKKWTFREKMWS